jgi:hypothetical protein
MVYWVVDMFEVEDSKGSTHSFVVTGNPPVQERAIMNWKNRDHPTIYDPSSAVKKQYGSVVKQAMAEIGIADFPYLSGIQPVTLPGDQVLLAKMQARLQDPGHGVGRRRTGLCPNQ